MRGVGVGVTVEVGSGVGVWVTVAVRLGAGVIVAALGVKLALHPTDTVAITMAQKNLARFGFIGNLARDYPVADCRESILMHSATFSNERAAMKSPRYEAAPGKPG